MLFISCCALKILLTGKTHKITELLLPNMRTTHANHFRLSTALVWVLGNIPSMFEVDRISVLCGILKIEVQVN